MKMMNGIQTLRFFRTVKERTAAWRAAVLLLVLFVTACASSPSAPAETRIPTEAIPNLVYCSPGGQDLLLDFYHPLSEGPHPAVIHLHSGRWASGQKSQGPGVEEFEPLMEAGFAVFSINFRLAPAHKFPAQIHDAKCAVRHIRANAGRYNIDPDWIGVYGFGGGAHLAALLGVTTPRDGFEGSGGFQDQSSQVQAVVTISGIFDLPNYLQIATAKELNDIFGVSKNRAGFEVLGTYSPIRFVSGSSAPFLLIHGDSDATVPLVQSQILHQNLLGAGVDATLLTVQHADHGLSDANEPIQPSRAEITAEIVAFFLAQTGP